MELTAKQTVDMICKALAEKKATDIKVIEVTTMTDVADYFVIKNFLMRVKEESEKVDLKVSIQKTKIMASGPITSWEIDGETVETVSPESLQMVIAAMKLKDAYYLEGKL